MEILRRLKIMVAGVGLVFATGPFLAWSPAFAHGTGYRQSEKKPISLEFYYSTGETMSYLEAKVFSPLDEKFAFQSGRTDEAGRFAFTPNAPGQWRVVVRDEEGHLVEAKVNAGAEAGAKTEAEQEATDGDTRYDEPLEVVAKTAAPEGIDLVIKAGLGVSLLFNVAAFLSWIRRGKAVGGVVGGVG
ncbi:MAG: DUF2914 domain-containing protein [Synergistaceae bacterium]|jgi:nickel transport protein|nr:DUF2914 domain-containing protein [Synergistaceae bacterium]